ncbi:MAG TPA: hypothetical protein VLX92_08050 [Kofleriaceae bacterium]|nr:hypothetical protein [Kofleriaceae bacterium]
MRGFVVIAVLAACSSSPANVAGDYTVNLTEETNGCMFMNWMMSKSITGVTVTITQSGSTVTAVVTGAGADVALDAALGSNAYDGKVDGDSLDLSIQGSVPHQMGNCAFTYNSTIDATLSDDTLTGTVNYTAATNNNSDCATIQGCKSYEDFNGTRPPP